MWWCYLVAMAALVPAYYLVAHGLVDKFVYDFFSFSSVTAMLIGLKIDRPAKRGPWVAFAVGTAMWGFGDISQLAYTLAHASVPIPSVADVLYLLGYPVLGFGMVSIVRSRTPKAQMTATLDGIIVAIAVGALARVTVLGATRETTK